MPEPDESSISAVLSGRLSHLLIGVSEACLQKVCILPGSFNPLHDGHRRMAEIAAAKTGRRLLFEICVRNVDKPPLTVAETVKRTQQAFSPHSVVITAYPTFQEKSQLFGGSTFVVGADTIQRIADPRYYDADPKKRDLAIAAIQRAECRFLVFGRRLTDLIAQPTEPSQQPSPKQYPFCSLDQLRLPEPLLELCSEVSQNDFDFPISSTQIRNNQRTSEAE